MFYKDLEVWKESIDLTILIYKITDNFPEKVLLRGFKNYLSKNMKKV